MYHIFLVINLANIPWFPCSPCDFPGSRVPEVPEILCCPIGPPVKHGQFPHLSELGLCPNTDREPLIALPLPLCLECKRVQASASVSAVAHSLSLFHSITASLHHCHSSFWSSILRIYFYHSHFHPFTQSSLSTHNHPNTNTNTKHTQKQSLSCTHNFHTGTIATAPRHPILSSNLHAITLSLPIPTPPSTFHFSQPIQLIIESDISSAL